MLSLRVVGKELRRLRVVLVYEDQRRALGKNVVSAVEGRSWGVRGRNVSARSRLGFFFGGKGILKAPEEVDGRCEAEEEGREGSVVETSFGGEGGRLRGGSVEPLVRECVPLGRTAGDGGASAGESPFMPFREMARPLPAGSRPDTSFSSAMVIEALGSGGLNRAITSNLEAPNIDASGWRQIARRNPSFYSLSDRDARNSLTSPFRIEAEIAVTLTVGCSNDVFSFVRGTRGKIELRFRTGNLRSSYGRHLLRGLGNFHHWSER